MSNIFGYLHVAAVIAAYLSAFTLFARRVGTGQHRMVGILYAISMLIVAFSGFAIYKAGAPSVFHVFSVVTIVTISRGWYAILRYRKSRDRGDLLNHYFNMAYSFMGLNLAAIAQALRLNSYDSWTEYLITVGLAYLVAVTIANRLIQKVFFRRFQHWFGDTAKTGSKMVAAE